MIIELPVQKRQIDPETQEILSVEKIVKFDLDTSVYSEERWETHFPALAAKEGLFQYISRIQEGSVTEKVKVIAMMKAIFCFIESNEITTYKGFAQMFDLATPEYTDRLINKLHAAFKLLLDGSSVKN
jgi:hypothetical protein